MRTSKFRGGSRAAFLKAGAVFFLIIFGVGFLCWSCESLADVTSTGAQIAGALGVIDEATTNTIVKSSDAFGRAWEDITPEEEYYIGRAVAANIFDRYTSWNGSPALAKYLNEICKTIVINSPRPEIFAGYHVAILDSAEINAFATSGGHILVTRGLIACADSEDALAAVIAHEIGHIQLQHSIKAIQNSRLVDALLITGTSVAGALGNDDIKELAGIMDESVNDIISTLIEKGYSRDMEFDADTAALALLAAAGYEPSSLISMLRLLDQNQGTRSSGLAKTHPSPAQRITNAEGALAKFKVPDTRSYRTERYSRIR
ncbi:MAG: M48 family metalloprotease [Treponema sp.]|jgi:predicted Zn-dependent protease|nr:M48 family metalloprotease [Treponema sp.]